MRLVITIRSPLPRADIARDGGGGHCPAGTVCGQSPGSGRWGVALALFTIMLLTYINVRAVAQHRPPPIPSAWLLLPLRRRHHHVGRGAGRAGILWAYPVVVYAYFVLIAPDCAAEQHGDSLAYVTLLVAALIEMPLALRLFATLLLTIIASTSCSM